MTKQTSNEASVARAQYAALAGHYRSIGSAAILAALTCMPKKGSTQANAAKR